MLPVKFEKEVCKRPDGKRGRERLRNELAVGLE
jgi:hypothetical protein